uniref:C2H2-type domain-containing protein n=1 Tax=Meloidogyne javanica TaxID=6303 RepID=A0A915LT98_MELJA
MNGWNRGFGTSNLMGRSEFSNYGSGSSVSYPQTEMNQTSGSEFIGNSSIRMPIFKCPECSIVKNTSEDFEIHVKVEHLNWLPFICPMCKAARASDIQMREHMHSSHKKNDNMYWYQDNAQAKKILQEIMDKALFAASIQHKQSNISKLGRIIGDSNGNLQSVVNTDNELAKRIRLDDVVTPSIRRNIEESLQSKNQNVNENISSTSGIKLAGQEPKPSIDEETDSQLSTIFGRNVKSEFDMTVMEEDSPSQQSLQTINEDDELHDNTHQMNALQNMAAMFSASSGSVCQKVQPKSVLDSRSSRPFPYKRVVRNRPGPMTSKKRVLGVCARCNKPITAGARQMHMFFHLGKDMQTFRFRCRHSGCDVEHYRKDQMENHQSKVHGQVDPNMMDDRSQELYNLVQVWVFISVKLSAQLMYEQQMRDVAANLGSRKRPPIQMFTQHQQIHTNINGMFDSANRKMEDLECRLCHKTIMSRIRGFHILWHLNNDLGIVRYGCKHCDFKHDRPQSVVGHGAREHADEYCCEDLLYNFEDELKSMSKACFGVERLFEKEIRRRTRMTPLAKLDVQLKAESSDRSWSSSKEQMRKKRSFRRFGTRVRSRRQREDMIKLREVSMRLGGAQYFKKKSNEAVLCEKCGKMISNRLSDHAYSHLDGCDLFRCQQCNLGHYSRETIVRHLRDFHNSSDEPPLDNRLRFAQEIKDAIRECYPNLFIDAPIPTKEMDTHEEDRDEDNEHNAEVEEEEELSRDGDEREGSEEGEQEDDIKEEDGEDEIVVGFELGGTYDNEEKHEVMNQSNDEERMEARNDGQQKRSRRGRPPKEGKEL